MRKFAAVAFAFVLAASAGCGGGGENGDDEANELTGLIVDVQGRGNDVRSFTLQTSDGEYRLRIAPEVDYGFQLRPARPREQPLAGAVHASAARRRPLRHCDRRCIAA